MKQLRDVKTGTYVIIPSWNDRIVYVVQPTEPYMPISDIDIVSEDGKVSRTVPCQMQAIELVTVTCMDCDREFEQVPHPLTGQAFYYSCPECRKMRHEEAKRKPARHGAGIYRGIRH